jgi:hypothetical protein
MHTQSAQRLHEKVWSCGEHIILKYVSHEVRWSIYVRRVSERENASLHMEGDIHPRNFPSELGHGMDENYVRSESTNKGTAAKSVPRRNTQRGD